MGDKKLIIDAQQLCKVYGFGETAVKALHSITLKVHNGEFVAIMGPSGSGKSTLLHLLGCLDKPTSGSYTLGDDIINNLDDDSLADIRNKKIGFVFQQFNLLPRTSALDNVTLPLAYGKSKKIDAYKQGLEALKAVGLEERLDHKPNELSGGQQQRVAIARALINNPSIVFADEPTGNLDTKSGEEIMAIFKRLNDEGKTIVLITHEKYIADQAKRTIHLQDGQIVSDKESGQLH